jgi:glucose-1-phosphate adenylyltransferase
MKKNNMVAMILAGGRGTRLEELTGKIAKPAVHYGGKYRIIDFPLSNCANSDIKIVGVLTQYESVLLNSYVAQDHIWGLDTKESGVYVLPPREKSDGFGLYRGTADAITQNIDFIDSFDPDTVLILSGDHIYKMDYEAMYNFHKENRADVSIAVLEVTLKEASRFGIMNTNSNDQIVEFEEKPKQPKSNLASMGVYIFNWKLLRKVLLEDLSVVNSNHDFGKDIIPTLINDGKRLFAYRFKGYWKDVGTIDSLWEANMDLLSTRNELDLSDQSWKIYTQDVNAFPQIIGESADVKNSYVNQGCVVLGTVHNSVLFTNVTIEEGAVVKDCVIMPEAVIRSGAKLERVIVGPHSEVTPEMSMVVKADQPIQLIANGGEQHG